MIPQITRQQHPITPVTAQHATTEELVSQRIMDIRNSPVIVDMDTQGHNVRNKSEFIITILC